MFNLANQLTLARIFFVVPIVLLLYFPGRLTCFLATLLFGIASLTDYLDGHIARKSNMVTSFGKFLDPLADKLLICSILIMFVELRWIPGWVTIIIIVRELAVTGLRAMAADEGVVIAADKYGKIKTVMQIDVYKRQRWACGCLQWSGWRSCTRRRGSFSPRSAWRACA